MKLHRVLYRFNLRNAHTIDVLTFLYWCEIAKLITTCTRPNSGKPHKHPKDITYCRTPFGLSNHFRRRKDLLLILVITVVDDVEEAESVDTLGGGDDTEPVTELVLLQELLGAAQKVKKSIVCALRK